MIYVFSYLVSIVFANWAVSCFGPTISPYTALVFIGFVIYAGLSSPAQTAETVAHQWLKSDERGGGFGCLPIVGVTVLVGLAASMGHYGLAIRGKGRGWVRVVAGD